MRLYKKLYTGENAQKEKLNLLLKMRLKKPVSNLYLITIPTSGDSILEIYPHRAVLSPHFPYYKGLKVLGIALGKDEARALTASIITEKYNAGEDLSTCFKSFY